MPNNFVGAGAGPYNQNSFDTRIDFAASQSLSVFGRFSLNRFTLSGAPSLGAVGGVGFGPGGLAGSSNVHNYSLAAGRHEDVQFDLARRLPVRLLQVQPADEQARRRRTLR